MPRTLRLTTVLAAFAVAALAGTAPPAVAQNVVPTIARGDFDARLSVPGTGAVERRRWRLSPSCLGAQCSSIRLGMRKPDGDAEAVTLRRDGEVYRGRLRTRSLCRGRFAKRARTMSIAVRVTRTVERNLVSGRATIITEIGGEVRIGSGVSCPRGRGLGRLVRVTAKRIDLPAALRPKFLVRPPGPSIGALTNIVAFVDDSPTDDDNRTWTWNFGDPTSGARNRASGPSVSHEFMSAGTYGVTLTVTDGSRQVGSVTKSVVVHP